MCSKKLKKVLIILSMTLTSLVFAQENSVQSKAQIGMYFSGGIHYPKVKEINSILSENGYAELTSSQNAFGIGFTRTKNNFIYQLDYYMYFQCVLNDDDVCSDIFGSGISLNIAYDFLKQNQWQLTPLGGFTFDRTVFKTSDNTTPQTSFTGYIYQAKNQNQVYFTNLSGNVGMEIDYLPTLSKKHQQQLILGLRTGYFIPMFATKWLKHDDKNVLENGPDYNTGGAYFKLIIGYKI